jgi:DNA-binding NarL/FixJ family response regulator
VNTIRILVADDHPVVRRGIREIISATTDIQVVEEAADGRELIELARSVEHDAVLLDVSMPEAVGLDVLKQLKRERPKVPVMILTVHAEDQLAVRALKAGAAGYLLKDSAPTQLITALRKIAAGGRYLSATVAEALACHVASDFDLQPHENLSDREFQVLRMIAAGKSTLQIASELSVSTKTVATYRARIREKMGLKSIAQLTAYVVRNRLAD